MSPTRRPRLKAKSKVWLEVDGRPVFGDGKAALLERIDRTGSMRAAAEALGMSYRALWGRLRTMERRLGTQLIVRQVGGRTGGGSRLTAAARRLLQRYRRFREGINAFVDTRFARAFRR
jgi:molybdate transport system regulatory protein